MARNSKRSKLGTGLEDSTPAPADPVAAVFEAGGLDFATPTEFVDLPSRGQFYPENHPLHGKDTVEIKYMTAKEEDILSSIVDTKSETTFDRLIKSLLVDKTINPSEILQEDKLAILLAARTTGYGKDYTTLSFCTACNKDTKHTFDLTKVSTRSPEIETWYDQERDTFMFKTPISKIDVELSNKIEQIEISIQAEKEKKEKYNIPFNNLISFLERVIVTANSVSDPELLKKLINVLPAADAKSIKQFYNLCRPQISTIQNTECQVCNNASEKEAPFTWALFRTDA